MLINYKLTLALVREFFILESDIEFLELTERCLKLQPFRAEKLFLYLFNSFSYFNSTSFSSVYQPSPIRISYSSSSDIISKLLEEYDFQTGLNGFSLLFTKLCFIDIDCL